MDHTSHPGKRHKRALVNQGTLLQGLYNVHVWELLGVLTERHLVGLSPLPCSYKSGSTTLSPRLVLIGCLDEKLLVGGWS